MKCPECNNQGMQLRPYAGNNWYICKNIISCGYKVKEQNYVMVRKE